MPAQICFRLVDGNVVACLPREPDGTTYLSLDETAEASGKSPATLRAIYEGTFRDILGPAFFGEEERVDLSTGEIIEPEIGADTSVIEPTVLLETQRSLAHALNFQTLDDEQFALVKQFADERKFDLLSRHVWAESRFDPSIRQQRMFIGLTIEGFRSVATRTGKFGGTDQTQVIYESPEDKKAGLPPELVVATVYRIVEGVPRKFTGEAVYKELCTTSGPSEFRDNMPLTWLKKCAKAAALREAFPNELGGIYTPEEMARTLQNLARKQMEAHAAELAPNREAMEEMLAKAQAKKQADLIDDGDGREVCSRGTFMHALAAAGIKSPKERERILDIARKRFKDMAAQEDDAPFYGQAIADVRRNPTVYGMSRKAS